MPEDIHTQVTGWPLHIKNDERPHLGWWAPGDYLRTCYLCKEPYLGDKRSGHCADCEYDTNPEKKDKP